MRKKLDKVSEIIGNVVDLNETKETKEIKKIPSGKESEDLQKKGWRVFAVTTENGVKMHTLEKI